MHGICICVDNSINLNTIKSRTNKLIKNLDIQIEYKHPINSTIGCYNAHIKALKNAINKLENNSDIEYLIICEEDIIINYESKYYKNIEKNIKEYNKNSNYILHLGGFITFTKNNIEIYNNFINKYYNEGKVYLMTCYIVNLNIAKKMLTILNKSSNYIHCDAIIANSNIKQRLVSGNIINQLYRKSNNTFINNYSSTYNSTNIINILNKFNILYLNNYLLSTCIFLYFYRYNIYLPIIYEIIFIQINKTNSKYLLKKNNENLNKNIYTFRDIYKFLTRLFILYYLFKV